MTAAAKQIEEKREKLQYSKMSMQVMTEDAAGLGIKVGKDVVSTAAIFTRWFLSNTKPMDDYADCSTCKGKSDIKLKRCPYCGDGEKTIVETSGESLPTGSSGKALMENLPEKSKAERELDEAIAKITELRRRGAEALWQLGHAIREVYTGELWMRRKTSQGKVAYTRFENFCSMELGMDRKTAYSLMDIASTCTIEQVRKYGATKLRMLVTLPEKDRNELLEKLGTKPARLLREAVDEKKSKGAAAPKAKKGAAPAPREISVIIRMGNRVVLPLLRAGVKKDRHPVAKTLADKPWAIEAHDNEVETHYSIRADKETGALELVIERRRK